MRFLLALALLALVRADVPADLITDSLPELSPQPTFKQYSGYAKVNAGASPGVRMVSRPALRPTARRAQAATCTTGSSNPRTTPSRTRWSSG